MNHFASFNECKSKWDHKGRNSGNRTHAAFYCGWPKAWAVFRMAKEVWNDENE